MNNLLSSTARAAMSFGQFAGLSRHSAAAEDPDADPKPTGAADTPEPDDKDKTGKKGKKAATDPADPDDEEAPCDPDDMPKSAGKKAADGKPDPDAEEDDSDDEMRGKSASAEARRRERTRCETIILAGGVDKLQTALHFAFKTSMSRKDAIGALSGMPAPMAAAAQPDPRNARADRNPRSLAVGARSDQDQPAGSGMDRALKKASATNPLARHK